jgi:polysaccharide deacetylase 2 family uncharacterized protein YibQ
LASPKKKKKKKKTGRKSRRRATFGQSLLKILIGFSVILLLVLTAGFLVHHYMLRKEPARPVPPQVSLPKEPRSQVPPYEIFPEHDHPRPEPLPKPKRPESALPRVAIIIDDLGYDKWMARKFLDLDAGLSFSVLPFTPYTRTIAEAVSKNGSDLMLHLPMEPLEYPDIDPGPGALLTIMSPDQLIAQLRKNLAAVPGIKGVNNHMGSKLTRQSPQMYQIFSVLKQQGLFFVDSRSAAHTQGRSSARLFRLPFAERDVFLDHRPDPEFIRAQIKNLIEIAHKNGEAIAIAHPHKTTYRVLKETLPDLKTQVDLVPISTLVHVFG